MEISQARAVIRPEDAVEISEENLVVQVTIRLVPTDCFDCCLDAETMEMVEAVDFRPIPATLHIRDPMCLLCVRLVKGLSCRRRGQRSDYLMAM